MGFPHSQHPQARSPVGGPAPGTAGPRTSMAAPAHSTLHASPAVLGLCGASLDFQSHVLWAASVGDGNWLFNGTRQANPQTRLQSSKKAASVDSPSLYSGPSQRASGMTSSESCTKETCLITLKAGAP